MKDKNSETPNEATEEKAKTPEELNKEIESLSLALDETTKQLEETTKKANQILGTASYYKNELDSTKKDFERYKERNKSFEKEASTKANTSVAKKLLPILDNFDQAIAHADSEVMKGFEMIYVSLKQVLSDLGVVEIEAENQPFNPEFHNCITTEATNDENLNETIACIFQKGYMIAETNEVVRPATVSVYKLN